MSSPKSTLVIITPGFPKDETDSSCLPLQQQLIRTLKLLKPGLDIIVISLHYPYQRKPYTWFDVRVIPFNGGGKGGLYKYFLRRKIHKELNLIRKGPGISALLSFWCGECAAIAKGFAGRHGLRHLCWILGQDAKKENRYVRRMKPHAGELVALSDFLQKQFEKNHGIKPSHLIPAGINPRLFDSANRTRDIDILGVGSLIPLKRFDLFIKVIDLVRQRYPVIKVVLAGEGPQFDELKKQIHEYRLESTITLAGKLNYEEVIGLMRRSRVLLHPSSYEGFSGVCLEALAAGAYVISFCRAMDMDINKWRIMRSSTEMVQCCTDILNNEDDFRPVQPFKIRETAYRFLEVTGLT